MLVRVWEIARWEREGGGGRGLGESGTLSMVIVGTVVVVGLPLKDIIGVLVCGCQYQVAGREKMAAEGGDNKARAENEGRWC